MNLEVKFGVLHPLPVNRNKIKIQVADPMYNTRVTSLAVPSKVETTFYQSLGLEFSH